MKSLSKVRSLGRAMALAAGTRAVALPSDLTFDNDFAGAACRLAHLDELTAELLASI